MARRKTTDFGTNWKDFYRPVKGYSNVSRQGRISYGPEWLGGREVVITQGGAENFVRGNSSLFKTPSTSREEGYFYYGCIHEIGPPGQGWQYQRQVRNAGARVGQATIDFVIESTPRDLAVRIVTAFFHIEAGPEVDVSDAEQLVMLEDEGYDVVDVFPEMYMSDPTGRAVRRVVRMVIAKEPMLVPGSAVYYGG